MGTWQLGAGCPVAPCDGLSGAQIGDACSGACSCVEAQRATGHQQIDIVDPGGSPDAGASTRVPQLHPGAHPRRTPPTPGQALDRHLGRLTRERLRGEIRRLGVPTVGRQRPRQPRQRRRPTRRDRQAPQPMGMLHPEATARPRCCRRPPRRACRAPGSSPGSAPWSRSTCARRRPAWAIRPSRIKTFAAAITATSRWRGSGPAPRPTANPSPPHRALPRSCARGATATRSSSDSPPSPTSAHATRCCRAASPCSARGGRSVERTSQRRRQVVVHRSAVQRVGELDGGRKVLAATAPRTRIVNTWSHQRRLCRRRRRRSC